MLVQYRRDGGARLFRQHDHALLSGQLAAAWTGIGRAPTPLGFELVLATALHDIAWRDLDEAPMLDPETGHALPFHAYPLDEKVSAYRRGLDEVGRLHPYAALLASLHYTSFPDVEGLGTLLEAESERRISLRETLELGAYDEGRIARDLEFLKLFDSLSIFLCLTPPSASTDDQPVWVESARHAKTPFGESLHLTWVEEDVLHIDPFPFRGPVEARIAYRELEGRFEDEETLRAAWETASDSTWWIWLRPAPRLA
jgi:hypothetical protein